MRQQSETLGKKFRVISLKSTIIHKDNDRKNYREAVDFCKEKKGVLPTIISQQQRDDFQQDCSGDHWLGAVRNYTNDPINEPEWTWPTREKMRMVGLTENQKGPEHGHNCLRLDSGKKYQDEDCTTEIYPSCELTNWRRYYLVRDGNSEVKIKNTFIIAQDPRIEYDKAKERCNLLKGGAKLAEFFTYRELRAIDAVFTGDDVYFHENETEWRFWIGAKSVDYHRKRWNSGDMISTSLRPIEKRHGKCLHYHIKKTKGVLHGKFTWSKCHPNNDAGIAISGYICQAHKQFLRD